MRYITNENGYIQAVSFNNLLECQNKLCTEYTGAVPTGYESLSEWSENANINAYKIVEGNLTYDSEEDARLQELWASQESGSTNDVEILNTKSDSTTDTYSCDYVNKFDGIVLYENSSGSNGTIILSDNLSNYNKIDVELLITDGNIYETRTIYNPVNKKWSYTRAEANNSNRQWYNVMYEYTNGENTIIPNFIGLWVGHSAVFSDYQNVKISKVVGYR